MHTICTGIEEIRMLFATLMEDGIEKGFMEKSIHVRKQNKMC